MNDETSLGEYLRAARLEVGSSLRALAERLDIAPSYLSDIENDRRIPADDQLRKFAAELDRDFNEMLALAGRLDTDSERFIRKQPEAVRLFRKITAANLTAEQLRELASKVPDGSQERLDL